MAPSAGLMILSAVLDLSDPGGRRSRPARWLRFAPVVLLGQAMTALLLDLSNKLNAFRFYLSFQ